MAEGTGPHNAITPPLGEASVGPRDYGAAVKLLAVLSRLPSQVLRVESERELRDALGGSLAELLGPIRRYELFVTDGPDGTLVPSGDARDGWSLLGAALSTGETLSSRPMLVPSAGLRGDILSVPLADRSGTMGVLMVEAVPGGVSFGIPDLESLGCVGLQIGLALQRLRLERRGAAHKRMERDMVLAREVQRRFLPDELPPHFGLRVATQYRPAYDVGGDFYDLVPCGDPGAPVMVVIGDVAGKGVAAALLMSRVSSDLRRLAPQLDSPAALLDKLNEEMVEGDNAESFTTSLCLRFNPMSGHTLVANAGHVPPIVRRASGPVMAFGRASGPPLGVLAGQRYTEEEIVLGKGDSVFLMTDGLVEALDRPGDRMGMRLLLQIINDSPRDLELVNRRILSALERERMMRHVDDVTLVAIELIAPVG